MLTSKTWPIESNKWIRVVYHTELNWEHLNPAFGIEVADGMQNCNSNVYVRKIIKIKIEKYTNNWCQRHLTNNYNLSRQSLNVCFDKSLFKCFEKKVWRFKGFTHRKISYNNIHPSIHLFSKDALNSSKVIVNTFTRCKSFLFLLEWFLNWKIEDWLVAVAKNCFAITGINYFLKYVKTENSYLKL